MSSLCKLLINYGKKIDYTARCSRIHTNESNYRLTIATIKLKPGDIILVEKTFNITECYFDKKVYLSLYPRDVNDETDFYKNSIRKCIKMYYKFHRNCTGDIVGYSTAAINHAEPQDVNCIYYRIQTTTQEFIILIATRVVNVGEELKVSYGYMRLGNTFGIPQSILSKKKIEKINHNRLNEFSIFMTQYLKRYNLTQL